MKSRSIHLFWLTSHSITPPRAINVVTSVKISSFVAEWYYALCVCGHCVRAHACARVDKSMCHVLRLFTHPLVALRLSPYFRYCKQCCSEHGGACYLFKWVLDSLDKHPEVQQLDHMVYLCLTFLRNLHAPFHSGRTVHIPTNSIWEFPFLYTLTKTCHCLFCFVFYNNHSGRGGSDLQLPNH